jgi:hypothetical protein
MMIRIVRRGRGALARSSYPIRAAPATRMRIGCDFAVALAFVFYEE